MISLRDLLTTGLTNNASDLHLTANQAPWYRIQGIMIVTQHPVLSHSTIIQWFTEFLTIKQLEQLNQQQEVDLAITLPNLGRFRLHLFYQSGEIAVAIRLLPRAIPNLSELHLEKFLLPLTQLQHGLVLVTGPTGSGKSTSVAALLNHINQYSTKHIITIEDPIEYQHTNHNSLIQQREIGRDTTSYAAALKAALREDPDIIMVGELRDLETIRLALTASETGHLVLATLHTSSAIHSIQRIIDVFPAAEKSFIRGLLAESLQAIICQNLVKYGDKRQATLEILRHTPAVAHLIREDKSGQLYSVIETGQQFGMQTMEQHLQTLKEKKDKQY